MANLRLHVDFGAKGHLFAITEEGGKGVCWSWDIATGKVIGDGKVLWESAPMQTPGKSQPCQADVSGVSVLELHVHCSRGKTVARAVWLDAHVLR
jgi:hypothetical protein